MGISGDSSTAVRAMAAAGHFEVFEAVGAMGELGEGGALTNETNRVPRGFRTGKRMSRSDYFYQLGPDFLSSVIPGRGRVSYV